MAKILSNPKEKEDHWNAVHLRSDERTFSWYQSAATESFALLEDLGIHPDAALVDVGGGASNFVDQLLARNFTDVTVLDISAAALQSARRRVGSDAHVTWLASDLLTWTSERRYDVWHDRAVFHFLTSDEIDVYRSVVDRALARDGVIILATFALDGPESCSGLAVRRYGVEELKIALGPSFEIVATAREIHRTPSGSAQAFTWIAARRSAITQ